MWAFSSLAASRNRNESGSFSENLEWEDGGALDSPKTVPRSRSHGKNRRVTPSTSGVVDKETKSHQNGDVLKLGKRLCKDGCVYEGERRKGKRNGKGKLTWPSGATYVGEFMAGKMEGFGTFVGSVGDVYRGYWVGDRKEGFGQQKYANGDYYEGMWKRNVQDGEGRYVWANGDEYKGECRNGVVSGHGVLVRPNGSRYEGDWENGVLKGSSTVVAGKSDNGELCMENVRKVSMDGGGPRGSLGEKPFPRICIWDSDGEAGDITCDIIDNSEATILFDDGKGLDIGGITRCPRSGCCTPNEIKKPGQTVVKGHKHYELMLNLQLGVRYVGY